MISKEAGRLVVCWITLALRAYSDPAANIANQQLYDVAASNLAVGRDGEQRSVECALHGRGGTG